MDKYHVFMQESGLPAGRSKLAHEQGIFLHDLARGSLTARQERGTIKHVV